MNQSYTAHPFLRAKKLMLQSPFTSPPPPLPLLIKSETSETSELGEETSTGSARRAGTGTPHPPFPVPRSLCAFVLSPRSLVPPLLPPVRLDAYHAN